MIKQITVDELRPGMFIHQLEVWWVKHALLHNQMRITDPAQIAELRSAGIQHVWIDLARSQSAPATSVPMPQTVPVMPFFQELEQAQLIFQQGRPQVVEMFNEARLGYRFNLTAMLDLVDKVAGSIRREPTALLSVARLKSHDDYTWLHSIAVCGLMILLAQKLGLEESQILRIGMGGLLHDIGKAAIPLEILNKPGDLNESEINMMRHHPVIGAQMLLEAGGERDLLDIVLHHHEKYDGSGYPHGLKEQEIPFFARIATVCDVYDALTSTRVYREGWTPAKALHSMLSWSGHFDPRILHTFVHAIGIYPVGSLVRLASGRVALVVRSGKESLLKPVVHAFWSLHAQRAVKPERLDLSDSFCTDSIVEAEASQQWQSVDLNRVWALAF